MGVRVYAPRATAATLKMRAASLQAISRTPPRGTMSPVLIKQAPSACSHVRHAPSRHHEPRARKAGAKCLRPHAWEACASADLRCTPQTTSESTPRACSTPPTSRKRTGARMVCLRPSHGRCRRCCSPPTRRTPRETAAGFGHGHQGSQYAPLVTNQVPMQASLRLGGRPRCSHAEAAHGRWRGTTEGGRGGWGRSPYVHARCPVVDGGVEDDCEPLLVRGVHELPQLLRGAVGLHDVEEQARVVAPRAAVLVDG